MKGFLLIFILFGLTIPSFIYSKESDQSNNGQVCWDFKNSFAMLRWNNDSKEYFAYAFSYPNPDFVGVNAKEGDGPLNFEGLEISEMGQDGRLHEVCKVEKVVTFWNSIYFAGGNNEFLICGDIDNNYKIFILVNNELENVFNGKCLLPLRIIWNKVYKYYEIDTQTFDERGKDRIFIWDGGKFVDSNIARKEL